MSRAEMFAAVLTAMMIAGGPAAADTPPLLAQAGDPGEMPQGNAEAVPQSMQDERRPASSGEDDLDMGDPDATARPRDPIDTDELPRIPDTARPHPREADVEADAANAAEEGKPDPGEPVDLDNEVRRGLSATTEPEAELGSDIPED